MKAIFIYNAQKCVFSPNQVTATNTGILQIALLAVFRAVFASAMFVYLLWKMNASLKVRIYSPLSISCTSFITNQLDCKGFAEFSNRDGLFWPVLVCLRWLAESRIKTTAFEMLKSRQNHNRYVHHHLHFLVVGYAVYI